MLRSITIKNFRSCEDVTLRLDEPVVALIGKNGTGKTNLLQAIQLAASVCVRRKTDYAAYVRNPWGGAPDVVLEFTIQGANYAYRVAGSIFHDDFAEKLTRNDNVLFKRLWESVEAPNAGLSQSYQIGRASSTLPTLLRILPENDPGMAELQTVYKYLQAVHYYVLPTGSPSDDGEEVIVDTDYKHWKEAHSAGETDDSVLMRLLHLNFSDRPRFDEIEMLLGHNGLGVLSKIRVLEYSPKVSGHDPPASHHYVIQFSPGWQQAGFGYDYSFSQLSAGTQRIIKLITHLIFDQSSCMLLEQPEDSIHPGLLEQLIDILSVYSDRTQLICTTHSPNTINEIPAAGIRFVTAENGKTAVSELSAEEIDRAKRYVKEDGTFAEFLETF